MYTFLPDDILCQYVYLPTRRHFMSICISPYQTTFYVNMYIFLPDDILCQYLHLPTRRHLMSICIFSYQTTFYVNTYIFLKEFRTHEKIVLNFTILRQWHGRRNNVEIGCLIVGWFQCRFLERWWFVRLDCLAALYVTSCSVEDKFQNNLLLLSLWYNILKTW